MEKKIQKTNWGIMCVWAFSLFALYLLNIFGVLKSLQSGGYGYYISLTGLFLVLFGHYYYVLPGHTLVKIKVRQLIRPLLLSLFIFVMILIIMSLLLPDIFKESELSGYRNRLESNGYTAEDVTKNMRLLKNFYYVILTITGFLVHLLFGFISLLVFKMFTVFARVLGIRQAAKQMA